MPSENNSGENETSSNADKEPKAKPDKSETKPKPKGPENITIRHSVSGYIATRKDGDKK